MVPFLPRKRDEPVFGEVLHVLLLPDKRYEMVFDEVVVLPPLEEVAFFKKR